MDDTHKEHRQRMYKRYNREGVSGFFDHELLEMLLFFSIPRGDTNGIAHDLLNEFGGIKGVMKTAPSALVSIKGIGQKSAMLLDIVGELYRRGVIKSEIPKKTYIKTIEDAANHCRSLFVDKRYECGYAVCLDIKGKVIADSYLGEGTLKEVPIDIRKLVETAIRHTAYSVVLAHNHPGGDPRPSPQDKELTKQCFYALDSIGIELSDHIIVSDEGYYSFASTGALNSKLVDKLIAAAQKKHLLQKKDYEYKSKQ